MFIYDAAVFVLTLSQAIRTYRLWSHSLATLMLKDGKCRTLFPPVSSGPVSLITPFVIGTIYFGYVVTIGRIVPETYANPSLQGARNLLFVEHCHVCGACRQLYQTPYVQYSDTDFSMRWGRLHRYAHVRGRLNEKLC